MRLTAASVAVSAGLAVSGGGPWAAVSSVAEPGGHPGERLIPVRWCGVDLNVALDGAELAAEKVEDVIRRAAVDWQSGAMLRSGGRKAGNDRVAPRCVRFVQRPRVRPAIPSSTKKFKTARSCQTR